MTAAVRTRLEALMADFFASAAAAGEHLLREFNAGVARLRESFERASEGLRKLLGFPPLANHLRRLLDRVHWTGIARRHAERPPTRGYWLQRCFCLACRERRGLA